MNGVTFDTYQFVTELKQAGFNDPRAEAVVNAIKRSHKEADIATKLDLERGLRELEYRLTNQLTTRFGVMLAAAVGILAFLIQVL